MDGESAHVRQEDNGPKLTQRQVAKAIECSRRQVQYMEFITRNASDELYEANLNNEISVRAAADLARLPEHVQREVLAKGKAEVKRVVAEIRKVTRNRVGHLLKLWNEASSVEKMIFWHAIKGEVLGDDDDDELPG